jgi:hypothetical protein
MAHWKLLSQRKKRVEMLWCQHNNFVIWSTLHYTERSESRCALRLRYVDLVVRIEVAVEVCCCSLYSVVKQRLKCNTGDACNCLIQVFTHYGSFSHFQHLL